MGTGRRNNHKGQKGPAALHKKGKAHTANSTGRGSKSVLRDMLPKSGMIYPFHHHFLKRRRTDITVDQALKNGLDAPFVTKKLVEGIFRAPSKRRQSCWVRSKTASSETTPSRSWGWFGLRMASKRYG
jgi:hypothetical protein